ncbi:hypothetical protein, partial [Pseudomonas fluorescens]
MADSLAWSGAKHSSDWVRLNSAVVQLPALECTLIQGGSWLACDGGLLVVYISVAAVTASIGSALTAGHFCKD